MAWTLTAVAILLPLMLVLLWLRSDKRPPPHEREDLAPQQCPKCEDTNVERTDGDPQYTAWIGPDIIKLPAHCNACGHDFTF